ncbi:putative GMC-type oxidoreductase [Penicillium chrysogenum]|uniref:Putative GMC-type oxidoreductase n=1 Tax=Penicillium chrysogenum TaxID=5076 RepID=A0A167UTP7_PENCH|nr:putative GMC-type oxidoreductase [Penicillium chrysogenum]
MGRRRNPLHNPLHYATPQLRTGPPVTYASALRTLQSYDYEVIVGAGAAGCVLASKLSEDKNTSVLLLEAGGDNTKVLESKVPLMFPKLFHTEHDWDYYTVEQPGLAARRLYWPRGRLIGGSTSLNAMMYHHCSPSDFDEWASVHGCEGWSFNDLAPYLRRMEMFTPDSARPAIDTEHRGSSGCWQTGYSWLSEIIEDGFIPACQDAGIPRRADVNTTNVSYKDRILALRVMLMLRVFFSIASVQKEPIAIGVELQTNREGPRFQVHARREVILCGGTVNTPQILMLSGIASAEELKAHGIPVIQKNDAVGKNMKDHLCTTAILCKAKSGKTLDYLSNNIRALPYLVQWMLFGRGPLTSNIGEAAAFIRSSDYRFPESTTGPPNDHTSCPTGPDLELIGAPLAFIHHGEEAAIDGSSVFSLIPIHLRPQSSGLITLQSKSSFDAPIINPKYLSDEEDNDLKVLLTGLRVCLRIIRSPAFREFFEPVATNDDPSSYWWPYSSSHIEKISDDDLIRFSKEKAFTLYHPVGTARMGPSRDTSVVDLECKVHGVRSFRVIDASVFPEQISGHPTAPIGAMAYKLSDMIRDERKRSAPPTANL